MPALTVKDDYVYFNINGVLSRIPRGGGAVLPIMPLVTAHLDAGPHLLISRFNEDPACEQCTDVVLYDLTSGDEQLVASGLRNATQLAQTGMAIYVGHGVQQPDRTLARALVSGGQPESIGGAAARGFASPDDDGPIYLVDGEDPSSGRIATIAPDGSLATVVEAGPSSSLAVDDSCVYFVEIGVDCEFAEIELASLMRAPR